QVYGLPKVVSKALMDRRSESRGHMDVQEREMDRRSESRGRLEARARSEGGMQSVKRARVIRVPRRVNAIDAQPPPLVRPGGKKGTCQSCNRLSSRMRGRG